MNIRAKKRPRNLENKRAKMRDIGNEEDRKKRAREIERITT